MKSKATLKQIAKELGVSVSTVSKALNDSPEISEPTKQRVQEYAKLKNYKPNAIGLNLKKPFHQNHWGDYTEYIKFLFCQSVYGHRESSR